MDNHTKLGGLFSSEKWTHRSAVAPFAVISVLVLVLAGVFVPGASAYNPVVLPAKANDNPEVTVQLSHISAEDPIGFDKPFTYVGSVKFAKLIQQLEENQNISKSAPNKGRVSITFDSNVVIPDSGPTRSDLSFSPTDQATVLGDPFVSPDNPRTWVYPITNLTKETTVSFKREVKTAPKKKDDENSGADVSSIMSAELTTKANVSLSPGDLADLGPKTSCTRVAHFSQRLNAGAWLIDIKFGDALGSNAVSINAGAPEYKKNVNFNDVNVKNAIKFEVPSPNGLVDISDSVMEGLVNPLEQDGYAYLANDGSQPLYADDEKGVLAQYPNTKWIDSLNWNYDPGTYTGNVWLPEGTVISINRPITFHNCFVGASTNFEFGERFVVNIEVGRPIMAARDVDSDSFTLPGTKKEIPRCKDLFYSDSTATTDGHKLYRVTDLPGSAANPAKVKDLATIPTDAAAYGFAASDDDTGSFTLSDKLFYQQESWDVMFSPYGGKASEAETLKINSPSGKTVRPGDGGMAFDPYGRLWTNSGGRDPEGRNDFYWIDLRNIKKVNGQYVNADGTTLRWNRGFRAHTKDKVRLKGWTPDGKNESFVGVKDFVFTSDGDMILVANKEGGFGRGDYSKRGVFFKVPRDRYLNSDNSVRTDLERKDPTFGFSNDDYLGIAEAVYLGSSPAVGVHASTNRSARVRRSLDGDDNSLTELSTLENSQDDHMADDHNSSSNVVEDSADSKVDSVGITDDSDDEAVSEATQSVKEDDAVDNSSRIQSADSLNQLTASDIPGDQQIRSDDSLYPGAATNIAEAVDDSENSTEDVLQDSVSAELSEVVDTFEDDQIGNQGLGDKESELDDQSVDDAEQPSAPARVRRSLGQPRAAHSADASRPSDFFWGMAYGRDGKLYVGSGAGLLMYEVSFPSLSDPMEERMVNLNPISLDRYGSDTNNVMHDMASCNFGEITSEVPEDTEEFKLQKSAVDPVTGEVLPAGTASIHPVQLSNDGVGQVQYLVTINNLSSKPKNPGLIRDEFSLPPQFRLKKITVKYPSKLTDTSNVNSFYFEESRVETFDSASFTIEPGELQPVNTTGSSASFLVIADIAFERSEENPTWNEGECTQSSDGSFSGAFANSVTMTPEEADTTDNHACIPVTPPPTVNLKLVKKIVEFDEHGNLHEVEADGELLQQFRLTAGGDKDAENGATSLLTGAHPSGEVTGEVVGGTNENPVYYSLSETPLNEVAGRYHPVGDFTCEGGVPKLVNGKAARNVIGLVGTTDPVKQIVTCTIRNTKLPGPFVKKVPRYAASEDSHHGKTVILDKKTGRGVLRYAIVVGSHVPDPSLHQALAPTNSGPINDRFVLPNGLTWGDFAATPGHKAAVYYLPSELPQNPVSLITPNETLLEDQAIRSVSGSTVIPDPDGRIASNSPGGQSEGESAENEDSANDTGSSGEATPPGSSDGQGAQILGYVSQEQLAGDSGIDIVKNVSQLYQGRTVKIYIDIPVSLDTTMANGQSVFSQNSDKLDRCQPENSGDGKFVNPGYGVINTVSIGDEFDEGNENKDKDNEACIPVKADPDWEIEKLAKIVTTDDQGSETVDWGPEGSKVWLTFENQKDFSGDRTVEAVYRIRVSNTGALPDGQPAVQDSVTLNGHYDIKSYKVYRSLEHKNGVDKQLSEDSNNLVAQGGPINAVEGANGVYQATHSFEIPAYGNDFRDGDYIDYLVKVVAKWNDSAEVKEHSVAEECQLSNTTSQSNFGLVNRAELVGEAWSEKNKPIACVPVNAPDRPINLVKKDGANSPLAGAKFAIYTEADGENSSTSATNINGVPVVAVEEDVQAVGHVKINGVKENSPEFKTKPLKLYKAYWLVETKAPYSDKLTKQGSAYVKDGAADNSGAVQLLAEPLKFYLTEDRIIPLDRSEKVPDRSGENSDTAIPDRETTITHDGGTFQLVADSITIHDPRTAELPKAGGFGPGPIAALGGLLLLLSMAILMKTSGVATRR